MGEKKEEGEEEAQKVEQTMSGLCDEGGSGRETGCSAV